MTSDDNIPDNWEIKKFGDVVESSLYGCNPETGEDIEGVSYLRISDINAEGQIKSNNLPQNAKFESEEQAEKYTLSEGDVVIARSGSIGQAYVYREQDDRMVYASYLIKFSLDTEQVLTDFIDLYTRTPMYWKQVHSAGKGAVQTNINAGSIKDFDIPVPPLDEQERIVEAVEERLERVERLEKSVENVGRLADEYEHSLRSYTMSGIEELDRDSNSGNPLERQIPEDWEYMKIKETLDNIKGGTNFDQNDEGRGFPVTRIETIADGHIDSDAVKHVDIDTEHKVYKKHCMDEGDILFSNINSPPHVGKTAIYRGEPQNLIHGMNLILMKPDRDVVHPEYLEQCFQWLREEGIFENMCKNAINQASLAQKDIKPLEIPVPPLDKQNEILQRLKQINESEVAFRAENVDLLFTEYRESILSHAFKGEI